MTPRITTHRLSPAQIEALPYDITPTDTGYCTYIEHAHGGPCEDCEDCAGEMSSLRAALPVGWDAYWAGGGTGDDLDVTIEWQGR